MRIIVHQISCTLYGIAPPVIVVNVVMIYCLKLMICVN
jgi:hypothetical protein